MQLFSSCCVVSSMDAAEHTWKCGNSCPTCKGTALRQSMSAFASSFSWSSQGFPGSNRMLCAMPGLSTMGKTSFPHLTWSCMYVQVQLLHASLCSPAGCLQEVHFAELRAACLLEQVKSPKEIQCIPLTSGFSASMQSTICALPTAGSCGGAC